MGWHVTYEVEMLERVEWDDDALKNLFNPYDDVLRLYLRDFEKQRIIFSAYTHVDIDTILQALKSLYRAKIKFRKYSDEGIAWTFVY